MGPQINIQKISGNYKLLGYLHSQRLLERGYLVSFDGLVCLSCVKNKISKKIKEKTLAEQQQQQQEIPQHHQQQEISQQQQQEDNQMEHEPVAGLSNQMEYEPMPGTSKQSSSQYGPLQQQVEAAMLEEGVNPPPSYNEAVMTMTTRSMQNPKTPEARQLALGSNDDTPKSGSSALTHGSDSTFVPSLGSQPSVGSQPCEPETDNDKEDKKVLRQAVNSFLTQAGETRKVEWVLNKAFQDYNEEESQNKSRVLREAARNLGAIIMAGLKAITTNADNRLEIYEEVSNFFSSK